METRQKELIKARRKELDRKLVELKKNKSCKICGFSDFRALEFHHRVPGAKEVGLSRIGSKRGWKWDRILEEAEKCDIICANCHRIRHSPHEAPI